MGAAWRLPFLESFLVSNNKIMAVTRFGSPCIVVASRVFNSVRTHARQFIGIRYIGVRLPLRYRWSSVVAATYGIAKFSHPAKEKEKGVKWDRHCNNIYYKYYV